MNSDDPEVDMLRAPDDLSEFQRNGVPHERSQPRAHEPDHSRTTFPAAGTLAPPRLYERWGKRIVDVILAIPLAALIAPVALITALVIRLEDRGPAIFRQERVGQDGSSFIIRKFRTMPVNTANIPSADAGGLRVTRVGRILRRTSLDELPQIVSVLRGDMSIVGPRPPIPSQSVLVELRRENGSLRLRPGLTGLAQVHGFDGMTDRAKAAWDAKYLGDVGVATDLWIMLRTFGYLLHKPPRY